MIALALAVASWAPIGDLRMYYEEHGAGRPLLLLHGGGSTITTTFGATMPQLARTHRVLAPEQQAHGHTADIDRPLSFEQMADDTAALIRQRGLRGVDVIGFSNGGMVALQLAVRHPELVRRLVICAGFHAHEGLPPALREGFAHATAANMPPALRDAYTAVAPDPEALPTLVAKTVAMMQTFADLPESALRAIGAPTLVMVGDRDVVSTEHAARLSRLVQRGELVVLPGVHGAFLGTAEAGPPRNVDVALTLIERFLAAP